MKRPMETNNSGEVRVLFVKSGGSWGVRVRGKGVLCVWVCFRRGKGGRRICLCRTPYGIYLK